MSGFILVHDDVNTKVAELEVRIVLGQFNKAIAQLTTAFEELVADGELDEARLVIGIAKRAKGREL